MARFVFFNLLFIAFLVTSTSVNAQAQYDHRGQGLRYEQPYVSPYQFNPNFQRPQFNPNHQQPWPGPYGQAPYQVFNGQRLRSPNRSHPPNENFPRHSNNSNPSDGLPPPHVPKAIVEPGDSIPKSYDDSIVKTFTEKFPRIGGEFESQNAILVSVCELLPQHSKVLQQIVEHTANHVSLVILCNDISQLRDAVNVLETTSGPKDHVSFFHLKMDTIWLRDFGPRIAEHFDGTMSIDFFYDGQRPKDDDFPLRWAKHTDALINKVPWTMHGGNLICNGKGLGITTTRIFTDNNITFPAARRGVDARAEAEKLVTDAFLKYCNLDELVVLEPLREEATRHVDMFAQFLAEDHVLLAKIDPRYDAVNSRVLELNAKKLSQVSVNGKKLKVDRIYIPPHRNRQWSPYTNTITANKMLLMPTFDTDPPDYVRRALKRYRELLPDYYVATIDTSTMKKLQGSLHCMSINIPAYAPLPKKLVSYHRALRYYNRFKEAQESSTESPISSQDAVSRKP